MDEDIWNEAAVLAAALTCAGPSDVEHGLAGRFPGRRRQALHEAAARGYEASRYAGEGIALMFSASGGRPDRGLFDAAVRKRYPWVADAALSALFNRGMYLAYRDGWGG